MKDMNTRSARAEAGFTLIEIAIVLVIIGLLLGGVLQGQQLIENSRVRSATNDFSGIAAAIFSYQDRYGRLPGDDPNTASRGASWAAIPTPATQGNGIIDGAVGDIFTGGGENGEISILFRHLKAAGFINGDPSQGGAAALPQNPFGGLTSIINDPVMPSGVDEPALAGIKVCMSNVTGSAAIALDTQLDDGRPGTGRLRATEGGGNTLPGTVATDYNEDLAYTICYRV